MPRNETIKVEYNDEYSLESENGEYQVEDVAIVEDTATELFNGSWNELKHLSRTWKVGALFLVVINVILLTFDSFEIKKDTQVMKHGEITKRQQGDDNNNASSTLFTFSNKTTNSQIITNNIESLYPIDYTQAPRYAYTPRGRVLTTVQQDDLKNDWNEWEDPIQAVRKNNNSIKEFPNYDFYKSFPNRDVPFTSFPKNAWQHDKVYMEQFLKQGRALAMRAMEAILSEYGHGQLDYPNLNFRERSKMFSMNVHEVIKQSSNNDDNNNDDNEPLSLGKRWTTKQSWEGLRRRILHAIMTEDTFVFAMGGHSAAAGHGNHFQQSYTLQVQKILEPIFARLGVKHESRNFGQGGLGTLHNGMAASSIYGPDVDILMWDSGMTEGSKQSDMMARQAIIGGQRVPFLMSFPQDVLLTLNEHVDADIGYIGSSKEGIPRATSVQELKSIPWAMRYMECSLDIKNDFCKNKEYNGTCWIERKDYTPGRDQKKLPGGQASWHPGFRKHQLMGRTIAFNILKAINGVLMKWQDCEDFLVPDEDWHMTDYYENIQSKAMNLDPSIGYCHQLNLPSLFCTVPIQARTEFTPRAYPDLTSIRSIMPSEMRLLIPNPRPNAYNAPDVFNPYLHPIPGEVDVLSIIELGSPYHPILQHSISKSTTLYDEAAAHAPSVETLELGLGMKLQSKGAPEFCDGTYNSFCNRNDGNDCLLSGHNDERGMIQMDGYSGWLLLNLPRVQHGLIAIKMQTYYKRNANSVTEGWTSINNNQDKKARHDNENNDLKLPGVVKTEFGEPYCADFKFQYKINGKLYSWDAKRFEEERRLVQRVVEVFVLMDNEEFTKNNITGEKEEQDVELAIRLYGCGRLKAVGLTHVYWA